MVQPISSNRLNFPTHEIEEQISPTISQEPPATPRLNNNNVEVVTTPPTNPEEQATPTTSPEPLPTPSSNKENIEAAATPPQELDEQANPAASQESLPTPMSNTESVETASNPPQELDVQANPTTSPEPLPTPSSNKENAEIAATPSQELDEHANPVASQESLPVPMPNKESVETATNPPQELDVQTNPTASQKPLPIPLSTKEKTEEVTNPPQVAKRNTSTASVPVVRNSSTTQERVSSLYENIKEAFQFTENKTNYSLPLIYPELTKTKLIQGILIVTSGYFLLGAKILFGGFLPKSFAAFLGGSPFVAASGALLLWASSFIDYEGKKSLIALRAQAKKQDILTLKKEHGLLRVIRHQLLSEEQFEKKCASYMSTLPVNKIIPFYKEVQNSIAQARTSMETCSYSAPHPSQFKESFTREAKNLSLQQLSKAYSLEELERYGLIDKASHAALSELQRLSIEKKETTQAFTSGVNLARQLFSDKRVKETENYKKSMELTSQFIADENEIKTQAFRNGIELVKQVYTDQKSSYGKEKILNRLLDTIQSGTLTPENTETFLLQARLADPTFVEAISKVIQNENKYKEDIQQKLELIQRKFNLNIQPNE